MKLEDMLDDEDFRKGFDMTYNQENIYDWPKIGDHRIGNPRLNNQVPEIEATLKEEDIIIDGLPIRMKLIEDKAYSIHLYWEHTYRIAKAENEGKFHQLAVDSENRGKLAGAVMRGLNSAFGPVDADTGKAGFEKAHNGRLTQTKREYYLEEAIAGISLLNAFGDDLFSDTIRRGLKRHKNLIPIYVELKQEY